MTIKRVLFSALSLMLLLIGRDVTTHSTLSAQSAPSFLVWSDDSHRLAVSIEAGALVIEEGKVISRCAVDGSVSALAFTPDGESLYVGTNEGGIMACNARTGRKPGLQQQIIPRPTRIARFDFNPDGSRFFISSGTQSPEGLYLYDASLTLIDSYAPFGFGQPLPQFLPDGTLMMFSRDGDVITVERDGEPRAQITVPVVASSISLTPEGQYLLVETPENYLLVFDIETGSQLSVIAYADYVMRSGEEYALLDGLNNTVMGVNLTTGEIFGEWEWPLGEEDFIYVENDLTILLRQNPMYPGYPTTLFRMDIGEMLELNVGQKSYARIDFALDDNLLLFGVTEEGTDIIVYPLSGTEVPALHPLTQVLSERVRTTSGHAFGFFDYQTLMVFDVNTGEQLHEHSIPSFSFGKFLERSDGNAYVVREDQTLTIRTLEGEESVITLPN